MPLDPKAKAVIDQMASLPVPAWEELDAVTYRSILDAARFPPPPIELAEIRNDAIPGPAGLMRVRIYRSSLEPNQPGIVYFHGGGFVIGSLDSHEGGCRRLSKGAACTVVSIDYRLAPEHPFPAAVEDAFAATKWIADHAAALKIDPKRIAVAGDSAGGNLAAVVALLARDKGGPAICHQLLVYPVTDLKFSSQSYVDNGEGYFLTRDMMGWFRRQYMPADIALDHPHASPLYADSLKGLPPATVITAEYDPLRDEGEDYGRRLSEAGVPTQVKRYNGVFHGFFSMAGVIDQGDEAVDFAVGELRKAFA
ncbi:MAG TPA: alpha/beta hydrolase [Alphaproteobacteria bacterium]|nr:alpha/beta hydrolase [Alphaproteobacteria bacterium]